MNYRPVQKFYNEVSRSKNLIYITLASFCVLSTAVPISAIAADINAPDFKRDTLSPVYDWKSLPYSWQEIREGQLPVSPVHWQRHVKNPVVSRGMNCRPIVWNQETIRVFYGRRGPGEGINYFDIDPHHPEIVKQKTVGPIISTGKKGSFDDDWVISPEPVRLSESHWRMYYSAKRSGRDFFKQAWSLGFAESFDAGKTWKKHSTNPVLTVGNAEWEHGAVGFCSIENKNDSWKMWYLGTDTAPNGAIKQVGYATSTDGIAWKRYAGNPIIRVRPKFRWEAGAIAVPRVIRDGRFYKVWYCCYEKNNTYAIGQAESFDGIDWYRSPHNPVLVASGEGWDSQMTAYPGVIRSEKKYLMWYSGNGYGRDGIGLAVASAPKGEWRFRIRSDKTPDDQWSAWKPLTEKEPERAGQIQFAILRNEDS